MRDRDRNCYSVGAAAWLKEVNCASSKGGVRWCLGIKSKVIQGAPADRVGVLVFRKRFTVPGYEFDALIKSPWSTAVTLIVKRAVVCPAGLLGRCMKADVADVNAAPHSKMEGLNRAI